MEKIKLSQIREQFPMYADVPDDQFLMGLRKKLYADIPRDQFYSRIEYDTAADPTDGMSGTDKFLAGVGKGMTDVGRGLGQMVGLVDRKDVAETRQRDAALMKTGAGMAGNVTGSVAALLPAALIPGAATMGGAAAIGLGTGLAAPSQSTGETLKNAALGGVLGPASILAGRAVGAGVRGTQSLLEPFTKSGQNRIAARTLQEFATNPARAAQNLRGAQPLVPGSLPTMAQGADDAGLAQLERTLVNNPETGGGFAERYAAQRAARNSALADLAGDPAKRNAAVAAREAAAGPLYSQAKSAVYEIDDKLGNLLNRPVMQKALARAKASADNQGRTLQFSTQSSGAFAGVGGAPVVTSRRITGQGLQDLKMALDDMLVDPASGIAGSEAATLKSLRGQMIDWMESANPVFKQARQTFAQKSTPINTMDVADALMSKLEPALARYGATTKEHATAYARALEAAKDTVKKQTGINKPIEEVIDAQALKILNDIAKDLGRKVKAEDLGRAAGSNTAQNLSSQNLLRRILGPTGLPQSWSESNLLQGILSPYTGLAKLSGSERAVMERLSTAALDPQDAARLLQLAQQPSRAGLLGAESMRYLPGASAGLLGDSP